MFNNKQKLQDAIKVARGLQQADVVIKNGKFLDVFNGKFIAGDVAIYKGMIVGVMDSYAGKNEIDVHGGYIVPGFIDAHVHIESSMVTPHQYQKLVLDRGTTTVIWDPHEIANVKGKDGIAWALQATENLHLDVYIMLPSCVPAVDAKLGFGTSFAKLISKDLQEFVGHPRVLGLAEMMNVPGVLACDSNVLDKIMLFKDHYIDGHCPLLKGKDLNAYKVAGIESDHEVSTLSEGREKLTKGFNLLVREGSSARNLASLLPLVTAYTVSRIAFCSDDKNPLDLAKEGHMDHIINKALQAGTAPELIFRAVSFSAATMYGLQDRGAIAPGDIADLCIVDPIEGKWSNGMKLKDVYKKGDCHFRLRGDDVEVYGNDEGTKNINIKLPHHKVTTTDLRIAATSQDQQQVLVIGVKPGQILTDKLVAQLPVKAGEVLADRGQDILKIAVFERHKATGNYTLGFVKGFGFTNGAIAMTINHDAHNIIAVGANDEDLATAINQVITIDGGIVIVNKGQLISLPLEIAGLMTNKPCAQTIAILAQQQQMLRNMGCKLREPLTQLAFLALPVIPSLKITDQGLVDVEKGIKVKTILG